jgi:hypothetical protein
MSRARRLDWDTLGFFTVVALCAWVATRGATTGDPSGPVIALGVFIVGGYVYVYRGRS